MGGELIGLVAVTLGMGVPLGALYNLLPGPENCAAKSGLRRLPAESIFRWSLN